MKILGIYSEQKNTNAVVWEITIKNRLRQQYERGNEIRLATM